LNLFNTVRYLKPVQFYGRFWFKYFKPQPNLRPAPSLRKINNLWLQSILKRSSLLHPCRFSFLNHEQSLICASDWNNPNWDKLWLYNLHYFDDLNAAEAETRQGGHVELIDRWINENAVGEGNGWEPYPTSLRVVNWIKWSLAGNDLSEEAVKSLAIQMRLLRKRLEIHLLGNHLFTNAKALIFAGLFFEGPEAELWLSKGFELLKNQLPEQILGDGGHFERSPMYHAIILDDLLDLINLLRTCDHPIPDGWLETAQGMLAWLDIMQHPDKEIALFNDAAFGIAPKPKELFDYAGRLGICTQYLNIEGLTHLKETGYIRLQNGPAVAFLDVAPIGPDYLPGHAHADTLSFELSLFEQRVIVDSGTSCYGVSAERLRQRSTAAHNTVTINQEDSSEVWGAFRVARRARPTGLEVVAGDDQISVVCSHTGYQRLPGRPVHRREWIFNENSLKVRDTIDGAFNAATGRIFLHPDIEVVHVENSCEGSLVLDNGHQVDWKVENASVKVVDSTWHPEFGLSLPNKCMEMIFCGPEATVTFIWT
jgi:uncharacterized heparinase superfamily protein